MNFSDVLPWAVFGSCFCAVWAALNHLMNGRSRGDERLDERLKQLRADDRDRQPDAETSLQRVAHSVAQVLRPKSRIEQDALKLKLSNAGFNSPHAANFFLAIKMAGLAAGAIVGMGGGLAAFGISQHGLVAIAAIAALGFYLPDGILAYLRSSRQERIFLTLPNAVDMLVCCIEVGQGLDASLKRVVQQLKGTAPDLCAEFQLYNFQLQMGRSRSEALHDLGMRSGVRDLNSLTSVLIQAERFGSSIGKTLRELSDSMRVKRRHLAEERAQKTAVKLVFPLVLFIFPGIFVILVGPAAILMINDMLSMK